MCHWSAHSEEKTHVTQTWDNLSHSYPNSPQWDPPVLTFISIEFGMSKSSWKIQQLKRIRSAVITTAAPEGAVSYITMMHSRLTTKSLTQLGPLSSAKRYNVMKAISLLSSFADRIGSCFQNTEPCLKWARTVSYYCQWKVPRDIVTLTSLILAQM